MEGALKQVAFGRLGDTPVAMQIAVPLAVLWIVEMTICVVVYFFVPMGIFFLSGHYVGQQGSNNRLVL